VKFILPFGPASGTDITRAPDRGSAGRPLGQTGGDRKPSGRRGLIAINAFVSANDDHTCWWVPVGTFAVHPYDKDKLPYDADRDLIPVANVHFAFLAATASTALNVGSLRDLVELVRANPGKFNWASRQRQCRFPDVRLPQEQRLEMAKMPYRDILQAPNDLAENRIQLLSSSLAIVTPLMQAGKVKVLAVTGRQRAPSAPSVPTVTEAGYPALVMESIGGIFGPRGCRLRCVSRSPPTCGPPSPAIRHCDQAGIHRPGRRCRGPNEFAAGIKELHEQLAGIAKVLGMKARAVRTCARGLSR
jgi:tripartite-type tricarboxylate transporter receptor subunit TctC